MVEERGRGVGVVEEGRGAGVGVDGKGRGSVGLGRLLVEGGGG